jgi:hypothetical protein
LIFDKEKGHRGQLEGSMCSAAINGHVVLCSGTILLVPAKAESKQTSKRKPGKWILGEPKAEEANPSEQEDPAPQAPQQDELCCDFEAEDEAANAMHGGNRSLNHNDEVNQGNCEDPWGAFEADEEAAAAMHEGNMSMSQSCDPTTHLQLPTGRGPVRTGIDLENVNRTCTGHLARGARESSNGTLDQEAEGADEQSNHPGESSAETQEQAAEDADEASRERCNTETLAEED